MQTFNMGAVPPLTFGVGRSNKLASIVRNLGGGPVLIIADKMLQTLGHTDRLTQGLSARGIDYDVAADVEGEPKDTLVDQLSQRARDIGAKCVVAFGGGAAMDAGKLVAAIAPGGQPAETYALAAAPMPAHGLPAIAIPTTAGTGSEVTRTAVVSRPDGWKSWYWGEPLMFSQAILDPELTLSLPPHITAWTGADAVAHALEGATAKTTSTGGKMFGLEALRILQEALPKAVADGSDIEARSQVLWASTLAGLALHNCNTHMGHNISHAMGSLARVHHGLATGLGLEVALPWLTARPEGAANYADASVALGGSPDAAALPEAFGQLMRRCGIELALPASCADVTPQALATEMKNVANHGMSQNSACPVSHDDLDEMAGMMMALPVAAVAA